MTSWTEISIPVRWGHLAAITSGSPQDQPILCVHGMQDNAYSFKNLIPVLPPFFYYVCIDLPGHGLSSSFPPGNALDFMDYMMTLKKIIDYFKWNKLYCMAHGVGAQLVSFLAAIFPENIEKIITIEGIAPFSTRPETMWLHEGPCNDCILKAGRHLSVNGAKQYTYEEAVTYMALNRKDKISRASAKVLVERSLIPYKGGYAFTTDPRLSYTLWVNMGLEEQTALLCNICCPHLLILCNETPILKVPQYRLIIARLKKKGNFFYEVVEGNHDVHLEYPERISKTISKFLVARKSFL